MLRQAYLTVRRAEGSASADRDGHRCTPLIQAYDTIRASIISHYF
jgi:hypothetical protein